MSKKPLILVTNDDSIAAPGIQMLIEIMTELGDVVVVAPDSPQSGMGHAITVNNTLQINRISKDNEAILQYTCSGTPADCVKIAVAEILKQKPDLCVSGINHGSNASINVIYSGTMSAAVEAGIEGIPAIGFSHLDYNWEANFDASRHYVKQIAQEVLQRKLPNGVVLNVNIPNIKKEEIKGIKICRQAKGIWEENFDKRKTPFGKDYYWLTGKFVNLDSGTDTDQWALDNHYISVVPVQFDLTSHHTINELKLWDLA